MHNQESMKPALRCSCDHINPLPTKFAAMASHKPMIINFIWMFNTRRYTSVHGFCFFKLFLIVSKGLTVLPTSVINELTGGWGLGIVTI